MPKLDTSTPPKGPAIEYLKSKGWTWLGSKLSKNDRTYSLWHDPVSGYEFTTTQAIEWQRKRDQEPELFGSANS